MRDDEIFAAIVSAIGALKEELPPVAFGRVHERSVAHRLAMQTEPLFPGSNLESASQAADWASFLDSDVDYY